MSSRFRGLLLLLVVPLLGVGLVACGGGDDGGGDQDANQLLQETFTGEHRIDSGVLSVTANIDAEGSEQIQGPIDLKLSGPFQTQGTGKLPAFDLTLDVSAQGQSFSAGAVSTGSKGYLEFQNQAYEVPANLFNRFKQGFEQSAKESAEGDQQSLASLGINPLDWVEDPQVDGEEDVGDAATTKITAGINVPNLINDVNEALSEISERGLAGGQQVPEGISDEQRRQIEESLKDPTFAVWTGNDDKTLRKLQLNFTLEVPEDQRDDASGLESAKVDFVVEITELNQQQTIEAPANPRPLNELLSAFGAAGVGGLGGGGGAGTMPPAGGGGADAPAPSSEAFDEYSKCVQEAGEDVEALQACAEKLQR